MRGWFRNLVGKPFGRLTVVERAESDAHRHARWRCQCACGGMSVVLSGNLLCGHAQSCGCEENKPKHGHSSAAGMSPTYNSWRGMIQRCTNPNVACYPTYGGAGVTVCERWLTFANFLAYMGERPKGTTLGRFLDLGNYQPGNCQWMTPAEQGLAQRKRHALSTYERAA